MQARISRIVEQFRCIGDACPNTCCQGWSMQVDADTADRYAFNAPELLQILEPVEDIEYTDYIMKRDPATDYCTQNDHGWCKVHRTYGDKMLGDACHFFPKIVRQTGEVLAISASLSCPEIARLSLIDLPSVEQFAATTTEIERIPSMLRNVTPAGMDPDAAWRMHAAFIEAVETAQTPAHAVLLLHSAAQSLQAFEVSQWPEMAPMALKFAASRIPAAEHAPADVLNAILAFTGLLEAAKKQHEKPFRSRAERIAELVAAPLQWEPAQVDATDATLARLAALPARADMHADLVHPMMKRWLQAQLSAAFFPFAGFGNTLANRVAIMGIRMATLQLAVLARAAETDEAMTAELIADEAHWLARFLDHLASPELSERMYDETGWLRAPRLHALLEAVGLA